MIERVNYQTNKEYLGYGKYKAVSGLGVINYKDSDGIFQEIDLTFIDKGNFWGMEKSIYNVKIPKYADEWFEFRNVFEDNDHTIKSRPVANHVLGVLEKNTITYTDAFGDGIDMEISIFNALVSRKIIVRKKQTEELNINFEFDIPEKLSFEEYDIDKKVKKNIALDSSLKSKKILFNGEKGSFILPMKGWDKSEVVVDEVTKEIIKPKNPIEFIESKFFEKNKKKYLRKTISKEFLEKAVYPIYADDDTGATSPGTMADDSAVGTWAWANVDNAKVSDNTYTSFYDGTTSHYLKATNFGFSIPSGATISGIIIDIERKENYGNLTKDSEVKIVKANGTIGTSNKADTVNFWPSTDTYKSYGANNDLWGESWSDTDINNSNFGIVLSAIMDDSGPEGPDYSYVDHIRITVYYTAGATPVDITKGLSYLIITETDVEKALAYEVKSSQDITKGLSYEVTSQQDITKGLSYLIKTSSENQKTLAYLVLVATDINKGLQYTVESPVGIQKTLEYRVITQTDISKNLDYEIKAPVDVQKGLQYAIIIPHDITKGLEYLASPSVDISKGLQYTIKTPVGIQKTLDYLVVTESAIEKILQYEIVTENDIQKTLEYRLTTEVDITKGLEYRVTTQAEETRGLEYGVTIQQDIQKGMEYRVVTNTYKGDYEDTNYDTYDSALMGYDGYADGIIKTLEYVVTPSQVDITKTIQYAIIGPIGIEKSLAYILQINPYCSKTTPYSAKDKYDDKDSPYSKFPNKC